jgi:hypothetical protein
VELDREKRNENREVMEKETLKSSLSPEHHAMRRIEGVELHAFLTLALDGGEWSALRPVRFAPSERSPSTHWIGGWVGPRAGLVDAVVKRKIPSPCRDSNPRSSSS